MPAPQPIRFGNPLNAGIAATAGLLSGVERRRQEKLTRSQALEDVAADRNFTLERDRNLGADKLQLAEANRRSALANRGQGTLTKNTRNIILDSEVDTAPVRNPSRGVGSFFNTDSVEGGQPGFGPSEESLGPKFIPGPKTTVRKLFEDVVPDIPVEIFDDANLSGFLLPVTEIVKTMASGAIGEADGREAIALVLNGVSPNVIADMQFKNATKQNDIRDARILASVSGVPIEMAVGKDAIKNIVATISARVAAQQKGITSGLDRIGIEERELLRISRDLAIQIDEKKAINFPVVELEKFQAALGRRQIELSVEKTRINNRSRSAPTERLNRQQQVDDALEIAKIEALLNRPRS